MVKNILLVGWWTGGHAVPLVNLVKYIQEGKYDVSFHWIGEKGGIEETFAQKNSLPFSPIICGKLRRYFSPKTLLLPFQVLIGIVQSFLIIHREKPVAIFSKWGYASLPVAIAGKILGVPLYLHESDSIPGLANRLVSRFATGIFSAFPEADKYFDQKKILWHGAMISPEIGKYLTKNTFSDRTQLIVSCGSQGASRVFDVLVGVIDEVPEIDFHIILGTKNTQYREKFSWKSHVLVYDFFYDQSDYFKLVNDADIALTRSSSGMFEFEAFWLLMIMVPLPESGNNHQYHNAKAFEKKGHELIEQKNIDELKNVLKKYRTYKKIWEKRVVDTTIFHIIAQNFLK